MTSLGVPLTAEAYDTLLEHYLKSKQFSVASDLLISMSPSTVTFNRFIHYCTQSGEMERAEMAFALMSTKSLPVTKPIINMMIRGHGGRGHLEDAMSMYDEMEGKYGLRPNAETFVALLDASLAMNDLERSMWAFEKLDELGFKVTINRIRKLVRGLCLERRKADAFSVFNAAVASKVPCDAAVCSDLIDLLQQYPEHLESAVDIYDCMKQRGLRVDIARCHALVTQLSQVDEHSAALDVLGSIPLGPHRADPQTYAHLCGACFRSALADRAMLLIQEYASLGVPCKGPDTGFFHMCLQGFKVLRCPGHATAVWGLMERGEAEADYACYKEYICVLFNARLLKPALVAYEELCHNDAAADAAVADVELSKAYICGLSTSKSMQHHKLMWDMFLRLPPPSQADKANDIGSGGSGGSALDTETLTALFDSCVLHARTSRIVEVGDRMEAEGVAPSKSGSPRSMRRCEQLRRARNVMRVNAPARNNYLVEGHSRPGSSSGIHLPRISTPGTGVTSQSGGLPRMSARSASVASDTDWAPAPRGLAHFAKTL